MGCGTSKSTQVAEGDITIKDYPSSHHHDGVGVVPSSSSVTAAAVGDREGEGDGSPQIPHEPSGQSGIEREVQNIVSSSGSSPRQPTMESTSLERMHNQAPLPSESSESLPKPVAFEVGLDTDTPKGRLPRRLSKIESLPKMTPELLAEKQKAAEDRKQKELDKRANPRLSKREKLRKEVLNAREMEKSQQQYKEIETKLSTGNVNRAKVQADVIDKQKKREEHARKVRDKAQKLTVAGSNHDNNEESDQNGTISYDASAEIEVDSTYNADQQIEFWESQSSQNDGDTTDHQTRGQTDRGSEDSLFKDKHEHSTDNNSTTKLEQYM